LEPRGGASPSYQVWGYKLAEYPALYILGGEWTGASAHRINQDIDIGLVRVNYKFGPGGMFGKY
jgi:hypothetical protein